MFLQPDMALPVQPADMLNGSYHKVPLSLMNNVLHEEIDQFCKQVPLFSSFCITSFIYCAMVLLFITLTPYELHANALKPAFYL